jgi:8-oxo-dGTP diphosphatase
LLKVNITLKSLHLPLRMVLPQNSGNRDRKRSKDPILRASLAANVILLLFVLYLVMVILPREEDFGRAKGIDMVWHGGHPADSHPGSCWCGANDGYCMCTPNLAIDVIVTTGKNREYLWLVRRKDTSQLATMGGFVEIDESSEQAVKRELMEEMAVDLTIPPQLFGLYSDPRRDNRRRTVSAVYAVHLDSEQVPRAGDDAKEVKRIRMDDIEQHEYFADHRTILLDYRRYVRRDTPEVMSDGDFATDVIRSTCAEPLA